ncbi:MAG: CAP domain-containing protein [Paraclostridium sp.]
MNKRFKTLLSLGVVSIIAASSVFPVNAASKETYTKKVYCQKTQGYIYINVNGKECSLPLNPIYSNISNNCTNQKPSTKPEMPEDDTTVKPDVPSIPDNKPSDPSDKPVTNPDNNDGNNNNTDGNNKPNTNPTGEYAKFQQEVVDLVNKERTSRGLKPVVFNGELSKVATIKSQDMIDKNYFDHNSPTYGSPFDMMKKFGISYKAAGENIAMGQKTPAQVMNSWMNSDGHRKNILSPDFTELGVGIASNGSSLYWTQMFIGK